MTDTPRKRPPNWQRDELILALDLYFNLDLSNASPTHPDIIELSNVLNSLPIHLNRNSIDRFRNPNGVFMKLMNLRSVDPTYPGKGLERGSALEREVWEEFANEHLLLRRLAKNIVGAIQFSDQEIKSFQDSDEDEFPEGKVLYRLHRSRERNKALVKLVKERSVTAGFLQCVVCKFDFQEKYGELGTGYIECHHTVPVSDYEPGDKTKIEDVALVCSNCHRMLHRRRPWLSITELKEILQ